jgi:hypothetical protein
MGDGEVHLKNGKLYDMLWEPLKKRTTKPQMLENIPIPKGSYECYGVMGGDDGYVITLTSKQKAIAELKYNTKMYGKNNTHLLIMYFTPQGELINFMAIG